MILDAIEKAFLCQRLSFGQADIVVVDGPRDDRADLHHGEGLSRAVILACRKRVKSARSCFDVHIENQIKKT